MIEHQDDYLGLLDQTAASAGWSRIAVSGGERALVARYDNSRGQQIDATVSAREIRMAKDSGTLRHLAAARFSAAVRILSAQEDRAA